MKHLTIVEVLRVAPTQVRYCHSTAILGHSYKPIAQLSVSGVCYRGDTQNTSLIRYQRSATHNAITLLSSLQVTPNQSQGAPSSSSQSLRTCLGSSTRFLKARSASPKLVEECQVTHTYQPPKNDLFCRTKTMRIHTGDYRQEKALAPTSRHREG